MRLLTQKSSFHQRGDHATPYLVDVERSRDIIMHDVQRDDEKTGMLGILELVKAGPTFVRFFVVEGYIILCRTRCSSTASLKRLFCFSARTVSSHISLSPTP
jgi:hypothetical protein